MTGYKSRRMSQNTTKDVRHCNTLSCERVTEDGKIIAGYGREDAAKTKKGLLFSSPFGKINERQQRAMSYKGG
jgi:hypothetical protein